jgi:asparagine N-glycosylation enzyme membrane subunit Stt3
VNLVRAAFRPDRFASEVKAAFQETFMDLLWTIAVILIILWLLGMVSSYTLGGFVHILLVLAIIVVLIRVIQGRRPV